LLIFFIIYILLFIYKQRRILWQLKFILHQVAVIAIKPRLISYNVASDQQKAEEMVRKSGQMGVPVIDINGKIIVGFNQPEIDRALRK